MGVGGAVPCQQGHTYYCPRHNLRMSSELEASESAEGMHRGHLAMVPGRMSNALRVLQWGVPSVWG